MAEPLSNPLRTKATLVREVVTLGCDGGIASRNTETIDVWIDWPYIPRGSDSYTKCSDWRLAEEMSHA